MALFPLRSYMTVDVIGDIAKDAEQRWSVDSGSGRRLREAPSRGSAHRPVLAGALR